jgi:nucleoside-diphosphate-sugar epimerase
MRIAVTGGAGFIGSNLCDYLLKQGKKVVCIDNLTTGSKKNIKFFLSDPNFRFYKCDIRDKDKLEKIFRQEKPDLIYHYAAIVGVKRTLENPSEVLDVNINGTVNVLATALKCKCQKVVNISSSEVYGEPIELPEKETSLINAKLPYAISKLKSEKYAQLYYEKHGLNTTSLRLFNVYGPRQDSSPYGFVVAIFINHVFNNKSPIVFGDGSQTRDFTYLEDNIIPTVMAGESDVTNGEVINISSGKQITILKLAELILKLFNKENLDPIYKPPREFEIKHRLADISKMKKILKYKPKYELKQGLELTIDWYKKNLRIKR